MVEVSTTTNASIAVQVLTGILNIQGLFVKLPPNHQVLTDVLKLETIVQFIELVFYVFMLRPLASGDIHNMAAIRYFDWFITTPTMLLTTAVYFEYERFMENTETRDQPLNFRHFLKTNKSELTSLFAFNFLMLVFGYLGETGALDKTSASIFGFIFFAFAFRVLYERYAVHSKQGKRLYTIMLSLWSLYGVASLLPEVSKNHSYNVLDVFAKNFFGLFLFYKIHTVAASTQ